MTILFFLLFLFVYNRVNHIIITTLSQKRSDKITQDRNVHSLRFLNILSIFTRASTITVIPFHTVTIKKISCATEKNMLSTELNTVQFG